MHFGGVVDRIEGNSWWLSNFAPGKEAPAFTFRIEEDKVSITEVPTEPFESLLLHVRKLTLNDGAENLH